MFLQPLKSRLELRNVHLDRLAWLLIFGSLGRARLHKHKRNVFRRKRQGGHEFAHVLPKVADMPQTRILACCGDGIHLNKRVYQAQKHLFDVRQGGKRWSCRRQRYPQNRVHGRITNVNLESWVCAQLPNLNTALTRTFIYHVHWIQSIISSSRCAQVIGRCLGAIEALTWHALPLPLVTCATLPIQAYQAIWARDQTCSTAFAFQQTRVKT